METANNETKATQPGNPLHPKRVQRSDWSREDIATLFDWSIPDLVFHAQRIHRQFFDPAEVQLSTLSNIKSGGCPEDCKYCSQSARYATGLDATPLATSDQVRQEAREAKAAGATRFCMGAAWRQVRDRDLPALAELIGTVRGEGLETCMTLGMLSAEQAAYLADQGLDYYNHNLDTSENYYPQVISTRDYASRLQTIANVRDAGIKVCCGGILGLGESRSDRIDFVHTLATMSPQPESVPVNRLVPVEGTPLGETAPLDPMEWVRTIAVLRLTLPASMIRLSAGRESIDAGMQTLCMLAGANSIFFGDRLLTTANPSAERDLDWLQAAGMRPA